MPVSIYKEAFNFLYSMVCGILFGFIYDIIRIKRRKIKTGVIFIGIEDIIYWILVSVIMFTLVFYSNNGELRVYIFIGILSGIILYMKLLSKPIISISIAIINTVIKVIKFFLFILAYPFRLIYKILAFPIKLIAKPVIKIFKLIYKKISSIKIKFKIKFKINLFHKKNISK